jgi:hypothetical protein
LRLSRKPGAQIQRVQRRLEADPVGPRCGDEHAVEESDGVGLVDREHRRLRSDDRFGETGEDLRLAP